MKGKTVSKISLATVCSVAAIGAFASAGHAFTITRTTGAFTQETGATTIDFSAATINQALSATPYTEDGVTYSGPGRIVQNSIASRYAAPPSQGAYNNTNNNYLTLGASQEPGAVTINLPTLSKYFGLYWGSVDSYNFIQFFNGTTAVSQQLNGTAVLANAAGDQSVVGAVYANFFANNETEWFDRVVLSSNGAAFESDNHAYTAVPTPALLPGIIGMGVAAWRKRKGEVATEQA